LLEKGQIMSEQKTGFMADLDLWSNESVISPLHLAEVTGSEEAILEARDTVRKAIRGKVLESYRNGQSGGPRKVYKTR
jgi:hypothetical protein